MLVSNIATSDTRYGRMSYHSDDVYIGKSLALNGIYSEDEVELWRKIIRPGDTVIDAGANIGVSALPLAQLVGSGGCVHAYEPQPELFALLQQNIKQNLIKNITARQVAVGDKACEALMPALAEVEDRNYGGIALGSGGESVSVVTLDDEQIISKIRLIKIDVEGMEQEVLQGAQELIARDRPVLYVEDLFHTEKVHAALRRLRYFLFRHEPLVIDNVVSKNVLAIPVEEAADWQHVTEGLSPIVPVSPRAGKTGWAGIARCGGVGDNLIAAVALRPLKTLGYKIEVISQNPQAVVFENNPFVDKLSVYDKDDWPKEAKEWLAWYNKRSKEYDKFANLSHTCEVRHAAFPESSSFWWPADYRRKVFAGSYIETVLDLLNLPHEFGPLFFPTDDELEHALSTKRAFGEGPIIGWCMSGTRLDKIYPQGPMVIARLIKELGAKVVLLAGPPPFRDYELARQAMQMVTAQNGSSAGLSHAGSPSMENETWPIRRILTFAQVCDLVIGPDTGPMWGVAFEPVPKILLHSHASVENITKHWFYTVSLHADPKRIDCWPCHRLHNDESTCRINAWGNGAACISDISADSIIKTAAQLLAKGDTRWEQLSSSAPLSLSSTTSFRNALTISSKTAG